MTEEFLGPDPSEESEADLEGLTADDVAQAVLNPSDWTTETLLNQMRKGAIHLDPPFQRRDAWTDVRKSRFIESLFMGLPIPQIVLAERKPGRGSFIVLDGKQRLLTLHQWADADKDDEEDPPLTLRGLEVLEGFNGLTFEDIKNGAYANEVASFDNQTIRTVVVRAWPDDEFLHLVFLRLNTGNLPLSPQELRNALKPGPFIDFAQKRSGDSELLLEALRLSSPDFRMRDVEVFIRFIGFATRLSHYRGNLKRFLDDTCATLNDSWDEVEPIVKKKADALDLAIETTFEIFEDAAFSTWNGEDYEGRFNRAVFDIMCFYFQNPSLAKAATSKADRVELRFRKLLESDQQFNESLTTTTKSIGATYTRLNEWGAELAKITRRKLPVPKLVNGRIEYPDPL